VLVAAAALGTTWAYAAAVLPAAHQFVKGEHFRYSNVLAMGVGEGVVVVDGPQTMTTVEDVDVVDVSASSATLSYHVQHDKATGFAPSTHTVRASSDGTWRYADGRIAENIVTWDPARFGPQPPALTAGQQWQVDVPRDILLPPGHAIVRAVSVDPDNLVLRVDGTRNPSNRGRFSSRTRGTSTLSSRTGSYASFIASTWRTTTAEPCCRPSTIVPTSASAS
jgi:hypothetical protein